MRAFQFHLVSTGIFWAALNQIVCARRFLNGVTLGEAEIPERKPYARQLRKLPVILSADEIVRFLALCLFPVWRRWQLVITVENRPRETVERTALCPRPRWSSDRRLGLSRRDCRTDGSPPVMPRSKNVLGHWPAPTDNNVCQSAPARVRAPSAVSRKPKIAIAVGWVASSYNNTRRAVKGGLTASAPAKGGRTGFALCKSCGSRR